MMVLPDLLITIHLFFITKITIFIPWQALFAPSLPTMTSSMPSCKKSKEYLTLCQTFCSGLTEEKWMASHILTVKTWEDGKNQKTPNHKTKRKPYDQSNSHLGLVSMFYSIKGNVTNGWKRACRYTHPSSQIHPSTSHEAQTAAAPTPAAKSCRKSHCLLSRNIPSGICLPPADTGGFAAPCPNYHGHSPRNKYPRTSGDS